MISICVPVLNRYDLLERLISSLDGSTAQPYRVIVMDNGRKAWRPAQGHVEVFTPNEPMGVAQSWNWFIRGTSDERFLVNDDIIFAPGSVDRMIAQPSCFVSCTFGFSCFLLRDECVSRVGMFDEAISPGYAYYEDRDYYNRMKQAGIRDIVIECGVRHGHSQTLAAFTPEQKREHDKRFAVARDNFTRKWGESEWSPSLSPQ
jgi:GT2 family glycosyltransferase